MARGREHLASGPALAEVGERSELLARLDGQGCPQVDEGRRRLGARRKGGSNWRLVGRAKRPRSIRGAEHGTKVRGRSVAKCKWRLLGRAVVVTGASLGRKKATEGNETKENDPRRL